MAATVLACGDGGGGETSEGTLQTTGGAQTTSGASTGPTTVSTGAPTTGDEPGTGSGGATTSTTGDTSTGTTGDTSTGTTGDTSTGTTGDTSTGGSTTTGGAACGDGVVEGGEACDDLGESKACNADCTLASCGDGKLNEAAGEVCDEGGETKTCDADCSAASCGDGQLNPSAGEACDGDAPANATCDACKIACTANHGDCNMDLADGCEVDVQTDADHCGACNMACPNDAICKAGKCLEVENAFHQYGSEGRTVYIFKTPPCADLNQHVEFCQNNGLTWWKAKSQADAQKLIDVAFGLDNWHTWIQVFGAATTQGTVDGFNVVVDGPGCVDASPDGWTAFRKWACSFCEPANNQSQSCCWDKDHPYDWFVCEG